MSKGRIVNLSALADTFGVTLPTVRAWIRRGCPYVQRGAKGREWQFNTAAVGQWREEQAAAAAVGDTSAMDLDEARRRKEAALAAMAELDLAQRRGELIEIEAVGDVVADDYTRFRARALALPVKLAPLVHTAETLQEIREIIEDGVSECLTELSADSEYGGVGAEADDSDEEGEAEAAA